MGFQWTDSIPWVISAASAVVSGLAFRRSVRTERREADRRARDLPAKFGLWLDRVGDLDVTDLKFTYVNRTTDPIRNITITLAFHVLDGGPSWDPLELFLPILPPADQPTLAEDATSRLMLLLPFRDAAFRFEHDDPTSAPSGMQEAFNTAYVTSVEFTDPAGQHWRRDLDGELTPTKRLSQSEIEQNRRAHIEADRRRAQEVSAIWAARDTERTGERHMEGEA